MSSKHRDRLALAEVFSLIARAARLIRGPWQFVGLVLLVILALALFQSATAFAFILAGIAGPLLVFALIPWDILIKRVPSGAILVLLVLAFSPAAGVTIYSLRSLWVADAAPPFRSPDATLHRDST